ncbi:YtpI family protein [Saliterribacillus persicus]|uniref:YtpI-like protein n=1 Tax=Saliterribacillus persicus TaxID=930114 RepID=A0A368XEM2_9BACI|nr:YtpI family protein [Saliterribacillus persicus]RCW66305.1 YtpI-like protein [Saliterribacillus persicus]
MIIFPLTIIITAIMYLYYKVMILRTKDPLLQEIQNAKARIALGLFMIFFGVNQYLFYETTLALYIALIFLLFGILQGYGGSKRWKHYKGELSKR